MRKIDEIVAVNIIMRMTDLKLEQKDVAESVGCTPGYLNKLIKGRRSPAKSEYLSKIATVLGCEEHELFQDPRPAALAEAATVGNEHHVADLKKLNRMLSEHLGETLADLKAMQSELSKSTLTANEHELLALFRDVVPELQDSVIEFVRSSRRKRNVPVRKARR